MKKLQKIFLIIWIPMAIIVMVVMALNQGLGGYDVHLFCKSLDWDEILFHCITICWATIFLYVIMGLDEIKQENKHK